MSSAMAEDAPCRGNTLGLTESQRDGLSDFILIDINILDIKQYALNVFIIK
jgi:hypothetical protein